MMRRLRSLVRRRWVWVALAATTGVVWLRCGSLPAGLLDERSSASTTVVDRHGEVLYETRSALGTRGERLAADAIPAALEHATLAAEDARFASHVGIDPIAVARALWRNVRAGRVVEGGSTITQQVAKLLVARLDGPGRRRGWAEKIREAVIALRLEHRFTKREILTFYLNLAPYGNQIAGAERAAQAYFGRGAATLTPAEAAFLAALPQQPTRYNPWRDASAARARQGRILDRMRLRGWLSPEAYRMAQAERLSLVRDATTAIAPHFVERVLAAAGAAAPGRVETTLDATLQRTVQGIIAARRDELTRHHAANVAVAVLDNRTGDWLAWEGSGNYFDTTHGGTIDGVMTPRQPGSALKPFTYAAAFERGYQPGQVLADVPSQFATAEPGILYSPRNYDDQFRGPLAVRAALAGSENVPAVGVAADIGVPAVLRLLRQSGFSTLTDNAAHYGLGITLGNAEVRLSDMIAAYAMLARGGILARPTMIRRVDARDVMPAPSSERIVSARTAFWITDILADDDARAFIFGRGGSLEFPFTVAAKTGTSQAYHDNWAVGYTRDVTVGVWIGNFDRTTLVGSSGVTGAGPIFHDVMLAAVERVRGALPIGDRSPILEPTSDVRRGTVCALSGMAPGDACLRRTTEWLPVEIHLRDCDWHRATTSGVVTIWPAVYRTWSRSSDAPGIFGLVSDMAAPGPSVSAGPSAHSGESSARPSTRTAALEITSPLAGATFLRDPTLRPEFQTLPLRASGAADRIEWRVDGVVVGAAAADGTVRWPLAAGQHQIEVRDARGQMARTTVTVR